MKIKIQILFLKAECLAGVLLYSLDALVTWVRPLERTWFTCEHAKQADTKSYKINQPRFLQLSDLKPSVSAARNKGTICEARTK